jgi:membrane-bound lytic murein transglycosylase F
VRFRIDTVGTANPEKGAFYMYRIGLTRKLRFFATSKSAHLWLLLAPIIVATLYLHWSPLRSPYTTGELVVLTRESPTTYYLDAEGKPAGFEYDLVSEFAKEQGWTLKLEIAKDVDSLIDQMARSQAHLAAAGLTVTTERAGRLRFGPSYAHERELVICGEGVKKPASFAALPKVRLEVIKGSSHAERLLELRQAYPDLQWVEVNDHSTEELLERAATGLSDCTVADASTFDVMKNFMPSLNLAMVLTENRDMAWAMPMNVDIRLRQALADFFKKIRSDGRLTRLREQYFGQTHQMAEADVQGILTKRTLLLPKLKNAFVQAQEESGLDWRLLAALAYQESQWNPLATSPTGVRGIMMLTSETADRLGVPDRLDIKSSILAGARYLNMLKDELPDRIRDPDRTWMALAAYNLGMGHLEDARRLAQKLGKNPNSWAVLKDVLPLLAKESYAADLRLGFARGGEGRMLAENVRIYYEILKRYEPSGFTIGENEGKDWWQLMLQG